MENERRSNRRLRRADDRTLQQAQALIASLEMIGEGVILLDRNAHIVFASEFAHAILQGQMEYVWINDDRLHFNDHRVEHRLKLTLARLSHHEKSMPQNNVLVIERAPPKPPLVMSLFPLPSQDGQDSHDRSTPCMMIIMRDPENVPTPQCHLAVWRTWCMTRVTYLTSTKVRQLCFPR